MPTGEPPVSGDSAFARPIEAAMDRALRRLCTALAIGGGLVLCGLVALTVVSVAGREASTLPWLGTWLGPVNGDFELVELGVAVAVFSFLPYCHINRRNVAVEVFTWGASARRLMWLRLAGDLMLAVLAVLMTRQLVLGAFDLHRFGETTMVLAIPVWWGYPPAIFAMGLLVVATAWTVWRGAADLVRGHGS